MDKPKQEIINSMFSVPKLLWKYYRVSIGDGNLTFHCPFPSHPGRDRRKSSKYFPDTNKIYCFTEQRIFSAYDILRLNGISDSELIKTVFKNGRDFVSEDVEPKDIIDPEDFLFDVSKRFHKGLCSVDKFDVPLRQYLKVLMDTLDTEE